MSCFSVTQESVGHFLRPHECVLQLPGGGVRLDKGQANSEELVKVEQFIIPHKNAQWESILMFHMKNVV
jgi:hypothetical protein